MPETMSIERRMMLLALGAEVVRILSFFLSFFLVELEFCFSSTFSFSATHIRCRSACSTSSSHLKVHNSHRLIIFVFQVLTPKETAVPGALAKAKEIINGLDGNGYMLQQFENPANPKVHRETTGPEIWEDTDGNIDLFISGVGTGGTITGVSQFIKGCKEFNLPPRNPNLITIGVEPQEQMLLTEAKGGEKIGQQGPHKIQGMGAGLVPQILDLDMIDEVVPVHSEKAMETTAELWNMGVPVGISSGKHYSDD
jgi:cysteine synthase